MRLKTTNFRLLLLLAICFTFLAEGKAQLRIYLDGSYIKAELEEEEKDQILESSTEILNSYAEFATFRDSDGVFSDEAYTDYLSIFSGNAEVYNDLAKKNQTNINYATYADNVYTYMQKGGVKFEITETYLDEITYDSSGFYVITVSFIKTMFNGLSDDNTIVNFPNNGKNFDLKMQIEVPEYDLSDAAILNILGESTKVRVESANLISVNGNYHRGSVSKTASTTIEGYSDDMDVDYNSYGVDVVLRRSINAKKTLFLAVGASAGFHNFSTDLSSFTGSIADVIDVKVGGQAFAENNSLQDATLAATREVLSVNGFNEELQVIDIQIPIGISYKVFESYDWDIFVDVSVVPTYSIASSGKYNGGLQVKRIPDDRELFPDAFVLAVENAGVAPYVLDDSFSEELVESASQFSAAAQITPMVHYKFNFNMAFEFGANISYGFLPYFQNETNHLGTGTEQSNLLGITSIDRATNPSVLQNGFKNVSVLRYGLRAGIVFKL